MFLLAPRQCWGCLRWRWTVVGEWQGTRGLFGSGKDKEKRLKKRAELWAEAGNGYFADLQEFRRNHGKRFEASDHLCSLKEATRFPKLSGKSLAGGALELPSNQISLVLISLRAVGMRMCEQYRVPFEKQFKGHDEVAVYEVSLVDKMVFRILKTVMERNLRKIVPEGRQKSFICYTGHGGTKVKELMKTIALANSIVGHAYLLDGSGNIRWRVTATPTQRELRTLLKCTKQLISESRLSSRVCASNDIHDVCTI